MFIEVYISQNRYNILCLHLLIKNKNSGFLKKMIHKLVLYSNIAIIHNNSVCSLSEWRVYVITIMTNSIENFTLNG